MSAPLAPIVGMRTGGSHKVDQVTVSCPFCRGRHVHGWHDEPDGTRMPTCGTPGASYRIAIGTRERIDAMRTKYPAPDGVVGLVPLRIRYAFECDGDDDIIGVVLDTSIGRFAMWLQADSAAQLAGHLVQILENREVLRERYAKRRSAESLPQP